MYAKMEPQLTAALTEPWTRALADKMGCPARELASPAMRRKLLDNYLMHLAKYQE